MIINIIDRDFNFLGQIDEYQSFIANRKWHSIGNFELHLNISAAHTEYLQKENIIFTDESKAYVILYREIDSTTNNLIIKGLELKSYLSRWIVYPPSGYANYRVNSNVETIMKEYIQATLNRKGITNVVVAENQNRGTTTVYQSRYKNLADELEKLSLASNLSWDISLDLDNKRFIFEVVEGRDITVSQDTLPPAIFSIEYDNIGEQKLVDSKIDFRNTAIVAGQGEGVDRAITVVGEGEGFDSFETFIDARDIENDNDLPSRGEQKLSETQEILTFDSRVLTDKNLIYEEDFKLGDIVTIQNNQWNITTDRRITEVTEIYESTGFRLDVAFGESLPTILDMVKKATDTPIVEGGSEGETGLPGQDGNDGVGIEYRWNGTQLGVKREDEVNYQYQDLEGPQGEQGIQGIPGLDGKSLEFHWNGTQLGIRIEGETTYQYVNLKGDKGEQGEDGERGIQGLAGKNLEFNWDGTQLGIRQEGQTSYTYVDLKGVKGDTGDTGATGKSVEFHWNGTSLGVRVEGESSYQYVNLKGDKGDTGEQGPPGEDGYTPIKGVDYFDGEQGPPGSDAEVTNANVINAIGYTPVNKAGDTVDGLLSVINPGSGSNADLIVGRTAGGGYNGNVEIRGYDATGFTLNAHNWRKFHLRASFNGDYVMSQSGGSQAEGFNLLMQDGGMIFKYDPGKGKRVISFRPTDWSRDSIVLQAGNVSHPYSDFLISLLDNYGNLTYKNFAFTRTGRLGVNTTSPTATATIQSAQGEAGNLQDWKDTDGNILAYISIDGKLFIGDIEVATIEDINQIGIPTKISELENDSEFITANDIPPSEGGGTKTITSATEPTLDVGDQWHKEI